MYIMKLEGIQTPFLDSTCKDPMGFMQFGMPLITFHLFETLHWQLVLTTRFLGKNRVSYWRLIRHRKCCKENPV